MHFLFRIIKFIAEILQTFESQWVLIVLCGSDWKISLFRHADKHTSLCQIWTLYHFSFNYVDLLP